MKRSTTPQEASLEPLERKSFEAALVRELRLHIPTLGKLTAAPLAKRIEELFEEYFPRAERVGMGQILWPAVDERETAGYGKRIEHTALKPVLLDAVSLEDIHDLLRGVRRKEIRKKTAVRLFEQAKAQGGVLSSVDVATMLRVSPSTICHYIKEYQRETSKLVPRRGTIHDMGPSVTHKRQICRMVILEGRSIEDTARATNHSPEAVTRYVQDYRRVYACLSMGLNVEQASFTTSLSKRLVKEYQDIFKEDRLQKSKGGV
jgi:predicted transcriptional regulator